MLSKDTSGGWGLPITPVFLSGIGYPLQYSWASLVVHLVKNPLAMQEIWVLSLGWEDPLKKGKGCSLQYSGLEKSMDCRVHGFAKSWA